MTNTQELQEYLKEITPYPIKMIDVPDKLYPIIVINTPIGLREFETVKEMWTGGLLSFLYSTGKQVPKPVTHVLDEIRHFSDDATQALIDDWNLLNSN